MYMLPLGNIPGNHTIFAFSHDSLNSLKNIRENSKYQVVKVSPGGSLSLVLETVPSDGDKSQEQISVLVPTTS